jgi:hypothetical protein
MKLTVPSKIKNSVNLNEGLDSSLILSICHSKAKLIDLTPWLQPSTAFALEAEPLATV